MLRAGAPGQDTRSEGSDRSRALRQVRQGLRQERAAGRPTEQEQELAQRLRASRERIAAEAGVLQACARCATPGVPQPDGGVGGECCRGRTEALFDELELAALGGAGTRSRHLRPPRAAAEGCVFHGPEGCALPPRHRPNKCLRYLCADAQRELHGRGVLSLVEALCRDNERLFEQLAQSRVARLETTFCEELLRRLR